jgi:hypothetical protein
MKGSMMYYNNCARSFKTPNSSMARLMEGIPLHNLIRDM